MSVFVRIPRRLTLDKKLIALSFGYNTSQTSFVKYDPINTDFDVIAEYSDGSTESNFSQYTIEYPDMSTAGTKTVKVLYNKDSNIYTSYDIEVFKYAWDKYKLSKYQWNEYVRKYTATKVITGYTQTWVEWMTMTGGTNTTTGTVVTETWGVNEDCPYPTGEPVSAEGKWWESSGAVEQFHYEYSYTDSHPTLTEDTSLDAHPDDFDSNYPTSGESGQVTVYEYLGFKEGDFVKRIYTNEVLSIENEYSDENYVYKARAISSIYIDESSIENNKCYLVGEELDTSGIQILTDLGTTVTKDLCSFNYDFSTSGEKTVTISYFDLECYYNVTVYEIVESIVINTLPDKQVTGGYIEGDPVDLTGLTVKATYDNDAGAYRILPLSEFQYSYGADVMTRGAKLTVSYGGKTLDGIVLTVYAKAISEVTLATPATKTEYIVGEELDTTGFSLTVNYEDGTSKAVTEGFIAEADLSEAGEVTVSILYEGFTLEYTVTVRSVDVDDTFISQHANKLIYNQGDEFDPEGILLYVVYTDRTEEEISEGFTFNYTVFDDPGTNIVTLIYGNYTEEFEVTVKEVPGYNRPQSIEVVSPPSKVIYKQNDKIDLTGMIVSAVFEDDTTADVTTETSVNVKTLSTVGIITVIVNYHKLTSEFTIRVNPPAYAEGTCGDNSYWLLDKTYTLTIYGTGDMPNYAYSSSSSGSTSPWNSRKSSIKNVIIEEGITSIGDYAFYKCTNLKSAVIPDSVTSIGNAVFSNCTSLTSVTIPDNVISIGNSVFSNCDSLTSATLGNSVTSIGEYAFSSCDSLTSVTIPDNVISIGYRAFASCTNLTSVIIGDNVTSIGESAFDNTAYYNNSSNWENNVLYIGNHLIKANKTISGSYEIKSGTKCIADSAFGGCENLTKVDIPNGITAIGNSAFSYCTSLASPTIPDSITSIGDFTFSHCESFYSIIIPSSIKSIGDNAFQNCFYLSSLIFAENSCLETIGNHAFGSCHWYLKSVYIPDGVISIGDYAFSSCSKLIDITIPKSVTSIGELAFGYNTFGGEDPELVEDVTIKGYAGSAAETYANSHSINFEYLSE